MARQNPVPPKLDDASSQSPLAQNKCPFSSSQLLQILENKDLDQLMRVLYLYGDRREMLRAIVKDDDNKTVQEVIAESKFDFNQKYIVKTYGKPKTQATLLEQALFYFVREDEFPEFDRIRCYLSLGADPNLPIDSEGNTVLHKYVLDSSPHTIVLRDLVAAGGDIFKKNIKGETPYDLATDKIIRAYLMKLVLKKDNQLQAAITMQRAWRSRKNRQSSQATIKDFLSSDVPIPKYNPPNEEKLQAWVKRHDEKQQHLAKQIASSIVHISHPHFLFGLKMATRKFNRYLMSLTESERDYIILIDHRKDKSSLWTTQLAQKYLTVSPKEVIYTDSLEDEKYQVPENIRHIVMIDDASYSGNQLIEFLNFLFDTKYGKDKNTCNKRLSLCQIHFIIPFITAKVCMRIKADQYDIILHHQEMLMPFIVKGTIFNAATATYFDHKIPVALSTIECIENGKLLTGEDSGITFAEPVIPPYKIKL